MHMLLEGSSIMEKQDRECSQEALSLAQLVKYNAILHARTPNQEQTTTFHRKRKENETPLPLYVATIVHTYHRNHGFRV